MGSQTRGSVNAHGLPVGSLRLRLHPQPDLPLPECPRLARGIVTLHARAGPLPSTKREPPTGKRWASPRRSRHGRFCSDEREPPTGKPWASTAADGPLQDPPYAASIFSQISTRALFCWASESESSGVAGS